MKQMVRLGFILAAYATVACVGLAFVYTGTQQVITERQRADLEQSLKDLFPQGDQFKEISGAFASTDPQVTFKNQYLILQGDQPLGVAVRAVGSSYGGPITVLVGVTKEGTISGVKILENKDTPGLGANAANPSYFVDRRSGITFYGQFKGKSVQDKFQVKEDVVAITASTITSKAVTTVVKVASQAAYAWLTSEGGNTK
ncbi:MAG: FMN-binding protein [Breznakiellaceae bacterium]